MSDDPKVAVLPVPEGSIIWLHNIDLGEADLPNELSEAIEKATGHRRFCVLFTNGEGDVEVLGENEIVERVRAALDVPA